MKIYVVYGIDISDIYYAGEWGEAKIFYVGRSLKAAHAVQEKAFKTRGIVNVHMIEEFEE